MGSLIGSFIFPLIWFIFLYWFLNWFPNGFAPCPPPREKGQKKYSENNQHIHKTGRPYSQIKQHIHNKRAADSINHRCRHAPGTPLKKGNQHIHKKGRPYSQNKQKYSQTARGRFNKSSLPPCPPPPPGK